MLLDSNPLKAICAPVTTDVHAENFRRAAERVIDACQLDFKIEDDSPAASLPVLQQFLHYLLNNNGMQEAAQLLWSPKLFDPRPKASQDVWQMFDEVNFGLLMGAASMSKCLKPNELCRRFDGSLVMAKDVRVGDRLAGDDGTSRTVLDTTAGRGEMFRVQPRYAPAFECNSDHVLSLICTWTRKNLRGGKTSSGYTSGTVVDVPLREYLTWSGQKKRAYRLFHAVAGMPFQPVKVDPYIYGAWLGDGTRIRAELTTPEGAMGSSWVSYWKSQGFRVVDSRVEDQNCNCWSVRHPEGDNREIWPNAWFRASCEGEAKRILPEYLSNSEKNRLALLAGIIDADGTATTGGYDITTKWAGLAEDMEQLGRGLGFSVTRRVRRHRIKSTRFVGEYHHVYVMGDISRIPTREKTANRISSRRLTAGVVTDSFTVESIGEGDFAGFMLDGNSRFLLGSGIVTHNSYTMGVRLMLEWLRDPKWTTVRVLGPSADHLEANLFSHLVALHAASKLPLPGEVGQLYIGLDRRDLLSSIKGVIIPIGQNKRSGRLQGMKRKPRTVEHPDFGPLSRMLIFLDEISNIPGGVWKDIDNLMANVEDDVNFAKGFKIFGAFNPTNQGDEVATRCTPLAGWESIDADRDFRWKSARGWEVMRLDALQSENVKAGYTIYPGLQTAAGVAAITKNAGGTESPGYYAMVRAMFPPTGAVLSVIPQGMVMNGRGEFIWFSAPEPVGGVDLALEGGATAFFTHGLLGMASGYKRPSTVEFPAGEVIMFNSPGNKKVTPRWALQVVQQYPLAKGATVAMKDSVVTLARKLGIRPQHLCVDRTGHGAGVADLIKYEFGPIIDVNYSEGASDMKIMDEDSMTCKEEFERMASELWFATKKWMEFKSCLLHPQIDMTKLSTQLTQRLFRMLGKKSRVEKKQDYIARGFPSPDEADSFTLAVHAARLGFKITLSMTGAPSASAGVDDEDWPGDTEQRIDVTNRPQHLEEDGGFYDADN